MRTQHRGTPVAALEILRDQRVKRRDDVGFGVERPVFAPITAHVFAAQHFRPRSGGFERVEREEFAELGAELFLPGESLPLPCPAELTCTEGQSAVPRLAEKVLTNGTGSVLVFG